MKILIFCFALLLGLLATRTLMSKEESTSTVVQTKYEGADFFDSQGRIYAKIEKHDGEGATMRFFNKSGQVLVELGMDHTGSPEIKLLSKKEVGKAKLHLRLVGKNESGQILFSDTKGKNRIEFGLHPENPDEDAYLVYYDSAGNRKVVIGE